MKPPEKGQNGTRFWAVVGLKMSASISCALSLFGVFIQLAIYQMEVTVAISIVAYS